MGRRVVAQAGVRHAQACLPRVRRASMGSGSAWTVTNRQSSEQYAILSRSDAGAMQPHPRLQGLVGGERAPVAQAGGKQAQRIAYTSLRRRLDTVHADADKMPARLVRGKLA